VKENEFIECSEQLPPEDVIVSTKIDDGKGCRNETTLKRIGRLWFVPDGSMYVYYTPTHWRSASREELERVREQFASAADASTKLLSEVDAAIAEIKP
jgi:hypothetical protein